MLFERTGVSNSMYIREFKVEDFFCGISEIKITE